MLVSHVPPIARVVPSSEIRIRVMKSEAFIAVWLDSRISVCAADLADGCGISLGFVSASQSCATDCTGGTLK